MLIGQGIDPGWEWRARIEVEPIVSDVLLQVPPPTPWRARMEVEPMLSYKTLKKGGRCPPVC